MFILTVHWDVRALWSAISLSAKLYLFCLIVLAGYTVFRLASAVKYLCTLRSQLAGEAARSLQRVTSGLRHLRQLHFLFLLIFGACFASECFGGIRAIQYSASSLCPATIQVFEPATAFAFVVFVILGFIHALQWFVSSRLDCDRSLASD
jgi:hypothetical protein